ncbi:hypothetical protein J7M28_02685 [bacterium]|nr:hypothetical protein [bacterium]
MPTARLGGTLTLINDRHIHRRILEAALSRFHKFRAELEKATDKKLREYADRYKELVKESRKQFSGFGRIHCPKIGFEVLQATNDEELDSTDYVKQARDIIGLKKRVDKDLRELNGRLLNARKELAAGSP